MCKECESLCCAGKNYRCSHMAILTNVLIITGGGTVAAGVDEGSCNHMDV